MRSLLFLIPHEVYGIPIFGAGIALACLAIGFIAWWLVSRKLPFSEIVAALPVWGIAAAIIVFVLPAVEQVDYDGNPIGLPIRGYGVMVLLGLVCGIGLSAHRGNQLGIVTDLVIGLGFWMMLGGVLGARTFYVVQKWDEFQGDLISIVKLTEGGLVIYGGVLGGLLAGAAYCLKHRLPVLATADLIAPGFLIGLALGRIGCLLHGCCFGGICDANLPTIRFPVDSVPFHAQLETGRLLGIRIAGASLPAPIQSVEPGSAAEKLLIQPGEVLRFIRPRWSFPADASSPDSQETNQRPPDPERKQTELMCDIVLADRTVTVSANLTPQSSLPVHPTQIYAAINALLLCILIWFLQPLTKRDGTVFLVAILLYAVSRFVLEGIRSDEIGQLGTSLTIAQLVAIGSALTAVIGIAALRALPARRAWSWQ
ncbi:MAG: prolipoprotein diacylglyceryl transferase [Planctomycetales bacterium]|nr:prolipoprotein diacylglyceryl transferase [Planctomycetales bacterium]